MITKKEEINKIKLDCIKQRVYNLERANTTTRKFKKNEMVDKILKIIMREVDNDN